MVIDTFEEAYAALLSDHAEALGFEPALITGPMSVARINAQVETLNAERPDTMALISDEMVEDAPVGSPIDLFKSSHYSMLGSRYLVTRDFFDVLAAVRWIESEGTSELAMGTQRDWFIETITGSDRTWKVWGNESSSSWPGPEEFVVPSPSRSAFVCPPRTGMGCRTDAVSSLTPSARPTTWSL